jgi:hypothetical protein
LRQRLVAGGFGHAFDRIFDLVLPRRCARRDRHAIASVIVEVTVGRNGVDLVAPNVARPVAGGVIAIAIRAIALPIGRRFST